MKDFLKTLKGAILSYADCIEPVDAELAHRMRVWLAECPAMSMAVPEAKAESLDPLFAKFKEDEQLVRDTMDAVASTRKTGKMAMTITAATLTKLLRFSPEKVKAACTAYIDRAYHLDGKREEYLIGIARNFQEDHVAAAPARKCKPGVG